MTEKQYEKIVEKIVKSGHEPNELVTVYRDGSVFYGVSTHMPEGAKVAQQKMWHFRWELDAIRGNRWLEKR